MKRRRGERCLNPFCNAQQLSVSRQPNGPAGRQGSHGQPWRAARSLLAILRQEGTLQPRQFTIWVNERRNERRAGHAIPRQGGMETKCSCRRI